MQDCYLIELKYLQKSEEYNDEVRDALIAKATDQLAKYADDKNIKKEWQLKPNGHINLTKLIVIFQGEEMKYRTQIN